MKIFNIRLQHKTGLLLVLWTVVLFFPFAGFCTTGTVHETGAAVELESVVVTSEKIEDFVRKNPSQVVSMDSREIEQRNYLQVSDVLGSMPGVDVKPASSGLGTRISIRGGGGSGSVLVLIDGRPAGTMQYGGVDLGSIPVDIVKKIMVFKPPVPVWLGHGSGAGAIYIETKNALKKKTGAKNSVKKTGKIRISGGSFGQANLSGSLKIDANNHDIMMSAGASHKEGKRDNSQKDQGHASLHFGKKADGIDFQVNAKAFVSDHGVSGPTYNPTPNASQTYKKGGLDLKLKGVANDDTDYDIKAWLNVKELNDTADNGAVSDLDILTAGIGPDLFVTGSSEANEFRFGAQAEYTNIDHTLTGEHNRTIGSIHGEYTLRHEKVRLAAGLRSEYYSDFYYSPGGHVGFSCDILDNTILKINAGYSENTPSFGQLYQPSHGSVDQVRGNPNLKKEEIVSLDLEVSHSFGKKNDISVSLFRTKTGDLIQYQRGTDLINRPENISSAVKQGVETIVNIHLTADTSLDLNYVFQNTENKDTGKELSYAPEHTFKVILKTKFKSGTCLEMTARAYSEQFTDTLNTRSGMLDDYVTTDLKLIHPIGVFSRKISAFLQINNLFDTDFSTHYGYPDDGFRVLAGANINF